MEIVDDNTDISPDENTENQDQKCYGRRIPRPKGGRPGRKRKRTILNILKNRISVDRVGIGFGKISGVERLQRGITVLKISKILDISLRSGKSVERTSKSVEGTSKSVKEFSKRTRVQGINKVFDALSGTRHTKRRK